MAKDIVVILGLKVSALVLGFFGFAVIAQNIETATFGHFATLFSAGLYLAIPLMFGANLALVRHLAESASAPGIARRVLRAEARAFLKRVAFFCGGGFVLAIGAIWLGGGLLEGQLDQRLPGIADIAAVLVFAVAYALSEVLQSVLRIYDGVAASFAPREIIWRGSFFALAALVIFWPGAAVPWLLIAWLTGVLIVVLGVQSARSSVPLFAGAGETETEITSAARIGADFRRDRMGFFWTGVLSTSSQHLVVLLAAFALTATMTAHFFAAFKTMQLLTLSIFAINFVLAPRLRMLRAEAEAAGSSTPMATVAAVAGACAWINTVFSVMGTLFFAVAGAWVLGFFGEDYQAHVLLLLILSLSAIVNAMVGPAGFVMVMFDQQNRFNRISLVSMVLGALVTLGLGIAYGLHGFAVGYLIWNAGQSIAISLACHKLLGVNATVFCRPRFGVLRR